MENPYDNDATALPPSLIAAIEAFEAGELYRRTLGADFVEYMSFLKRAEWKRYLATVTEWEQTEYFGIF